MLDATLQVARGAFQFLLHRIKSVPDCDTQMRAVGLVTLVTPHNQLLAWYANLNRDLVEIPRFLALMRSPDINMATGNAIMDFLKPRSLFRNQRLDLIRWFDMLERNFDRCLH